MNSVTLADIIATARDVHIGIIKFQFNNITIIITGTLPIVIYIVTFIDES